MSAISSPASPPERRRLWPLAVVGAAAAAIALPLAFLHGKHPATTPAPAPAPANAAPATAAPTVHAAQPSVRAHAASAGPGHLSDPFGRHITAPNAASGSTGSSSTPAAGQATPVKTRTAPATTTPPAATPTPPVTPVPAPHVTAPVQPWGVYRADVRVTPTSAAAVHRRLTRLSPLPSAHAPFVLYLGAVRGGHRVAFLLNRLASASGAGRCARFDGPYQALYLKPGQSERVTISALGTPVTYRVGVMHVHGRHASSSQAARTANRPVSKSGQTLLRRYGLLGSVHFSGPYGTVPAPKHTHACG